MSDGAPSLSLLRASLGAWADAALPVLADAPPPLAALEASARCRSGRYEGGRMMLERLEPARALALFDALRLPLDAPRRLLAAAPGAPVIGGWDVGRSLPVLKLYLNLSDASRTLRERAATALGLEGAPHVVGINLGRDAAAAARVERKAYHQLAALPADAPAALRSWSASRALAGVVQSLDVTEDGRVAGRAVFVAPSDAADAAVGLASLPGWQAEAFAAQIPYRWEQVRSLGFSQDGAAWVAYVKPLGQGVPLWSLEPAVCVRTPSGELGVFVAPVGGGERAYAVQGPHALSYRVRAGTPDPDTVAHVMAWAQSVLTGVQVADEADWRGSPPPEGCDVVAR
ncbi:MAG: hypothetical protein RIT45_1788 [Pseudomonadota bacterium]